MSNEFDETFAAWVDILAQLRPEVIDAVADPAERKAVCDALADWPWLERVRREGVGPVREAMRAVIREAAERGGVV